jgi:hypothetical protein
MGRAINAIDQLLLAHHSANMSFSLGFIVPRPADSDAETNEKQEGKH